MTWVQSYEAPRDPFAPELVAWEARARADLAAIVKEPPPRALIDELAGIREWRSLGVAIAARILGLRSSDELGALLVGCGPKVRKEVSGLVNALFRSDTFPDWCYAHRIGTDVESLVSNAVERPITMFRKAGRLT